jgi:hypothetical protein
MVRSKGTTTEPDVNEVYSVGMNHSKRASTTLWTRTRVPGWVAELYSLAGASQVILLEEGTGPLLQRR